MPDHPHDVVIVGAGPAGAFSALYLLREGIRPVILEKETFPRYHIGESLTGECAACLRDLGLGPQMEQGNWPVKRGVKVYGNGAENHFWIPVQRRSADGILVDATTWQVRRGDFDRLLLEIAVERGAQLVRGEAVAPICEGDVIVGVVYRKPDHSIAELRSKVLIDASGQATFLASRSHATSGKEMGRYDRQIAVFGQIRQAVRDEGEDAGNTLIFTHSKNRWGWLIPRDQEVSSVGVVCPSAYFKEFDGTLDEFLCRELRILNPELARRTPDLTFWEPVRAISNYSYQVHRFAGLGFLCVGDSHRFIDPIFSFGVYFAAAEASLAAQAIKQAFDGNAGFSEQIFADYQMLCERGQNAIQDLIDGFWEFPLAFLIYAHYQHPEAMSDLFAGRIHIPEVEYNPALAGLRQMLTRGKAAEASPANFEALLS